MVIDTSALIAILCDEPEAPRIEATIEADPVRLQGICVRAGGVGHRL
jgi:uncharacterized protein with PIN domain